MSNDGKKTFNVYVSQEVTHGRTIQVLAYSEGEAADIAIEIAQSGEIELEPEGGDHGKFEVEVRGETEYRRVQFEVAYDVTHYDTYEIDVPVGVDPREFVDRLLIVNTESGEFDPVKLRELKLDLVYSSEEDPGEGGNYQMIGCWDVSG